MRFQMAAEPEDLELEEVARNFADLWASIRRAGGGAAEQRRDLIDRVRDALDRGEARLAESAPAIVANSFVLEELVSSSRSSRIYRARHRDLESLHAVKMVSPENIDDPVARRLLLREGEIGLSLAHPRIMSTQTVLRLPDGSPALVLPWSESSLEKFLQEGVLDTQMIRTISTAILSSLSAVHAAGYVHGDIAPGNFLMARGDITRLRIGDFGIAVKIGSSHPALDLAFAGRPEFASPEQKAGQPLDPRSDVYSVGRLLSCMLGLLGEHGTANEDGRRLMLLAGHLSEPHPQDRPATAEAAMALIES